MDWSCHLKPSVALVMRAFHNQMTDELPQRTRRLLYLLHQYRSIRLGINTVLLRYIFKKKKKKMLLCAQTNPSLVMGTFLSLHCDLWQPAWQICNLNGVAVVQNAAWWATGEEAVEKPSLKDKVGSFSWSIILSDCAFRNASYAAPAALTCNCHCQLKMVEQGENICS